MVVSYTVQARQFVGSLHDPDVDRAASVKTTDRELAEEWAQEKVEAGWRCWLYDDQHATPFPEASNLRLIEEWGPEGRRKVAR